VNKNKVIYVLLVMTSIVSMSSASATSFWVTGKIKTVMVDQYYSGCMIYMDKNIGYTCPANGWVSLDCKAQFDDKSIETANKKFASALAAAQSGKTVKVLVNDLNKANGYCVARRIDVNY